MRILWQCEDNDEPRRSPGVPPPFQKNRANQRQAKRRRLNARPSINYLSVFMLKRETPAEAANQTGKQRRPSGRHRIVYHYVSSNAECDRTEWNLLSSLSLPIYRLSLTAENAVRSVTFHLERATVVGWPGSRFDGGK